MANNSIWNRLSSLWRTDTDKQHTSDTNAGTLESTQSPPVKNKSVGYAEDIEYGVNERELPDEDHILRLLVKNGGRIEQSKISLATDWSDDHLSSVIEEMESDNQISCIDVGRKRVVCRRGFEPKGYRSHLQE